MDSYRDHLRQRSGLRASRLIPADRSLRGPNDPNERLLWIADRACDILLLGQNLSSEINGQGSRAAAEVHREVELDLYETYAEFLVAILNEQLIPALIRQNWGNLDEVPFVDVEIPRPARDQEMALRDKVLFQEMGLPVSLQYLYERHRVPSPDPGGALFQCSKVPSQTESPAAPAKAGEFACRCREKVDARSEGAAGLAARQQAAIAAFPQQLVEAEIGGFLAVARDIFHDPFEIRDRRVGQADFEIHVGSIRRTSPIGVVPR